VAEPDPSARVEVELSRLLRRARRLASEVAGSVHPDLRPGDFALLRAVVELGPSRSGDLAARVGLDKSTTSRLITNLRDLGLVRATVDGSDARARLVELTADGKRRYTRMQAERRARFASYLATWDGEDLTRLAVLLHRLNTDLDD
jgi:DNA-binding MarR family transcriptional regulator